MSENRFLSYILTEGIILTILGLLMLILPKTTEVSFGLTFCTVLIVYGGYKMITSFLSRNFERYYIMNILVYAILLVTGLVMLVLPVIDMTILVSVLGIYFVLESVLTNAFISQTKSILSLPRFICLLSLVQLFFGLLLVIFLPTLWMGGILIGLDFLLTGVILLNLYISKQLTV